MSKKILRFEASIGAGNQFVGNEFRYQSGSRKVFKLEELDLQMGSESKTFRIEKRKLDGTVMLLLQQSVDLAGMPAATMNESVHLQGEDVGVLLLPGEQIQVITAAATSAMLCTQYLVETDFV